MALRLIVLALIACLTFLFVAGRGPVPEKDTDQTTLSWAISSEMQGLDPHLVTSSESFRVIRCLYQTLLRMNPQTMQPEPGTAASYTVSEDGLIYTFHIRPQAKWSNGDPVTAEDYVSSWQRMMLPDYGAEYKALYHFIQGAQDTWKDRQKQLDQFAKQKDIDPQALFKQWEQDSFKTKVGLKALDEHTLQVRLHAPCAFFDQLVSFAAFSPVHQKSYQKTLGFDPNSGRIVRDDSYFADPKRLITNGPYVLKRWSLNDRTILEQNPHYWNKASMRNTRLVQYKIEDLGLQLKQYATNQIQWIPKPPSGSSLVADMIQEANKGLREDVHVQPGAGTYFYRFNCRPTINGEPNPLADARVRQALAMTVDRAYLVDRVTRQNQPTLVTLVPPGTINGYTSPVKQGPHFNPEKAQALLAEAGYPNGEGLEGLVFLYNTGSSHEILGQAIKEGWKKHLNINVALEGNTWGNVLERAKKGDFSILRSGWFGDYKDPTTWLDMFREEDGNNHGMYISKAYEAKLQQAINEVDPQKRFALLTEAETILMQDCPIIPLYQYVDVHLFNPKIVENMHANAWNYEQLEKVLVK